MRYDTMRYYTILYYTILYYTILYYTILYCAMPALQVFLLCPPGDTEHLVDGRLRKAYAGSSELVPQKLPNKDFRHACGDCPQMGPYIMVQVEIRVPM